MVHDVRCESFSPERTNPGSKPRPLEVAVHHAGHLIMRYNGMNKCRPMPQERYMNDNFLKLQKPTLKHPFETVVVK